MLRATGSPTNAALNALQLSSQVVTVATVINTQSPYKTTQNSATSLTHTLNNGVANERHNFFNNGTGTMSIAGTFLGGYTSPRNIAQGNGLTVAWDAVLGGWGFE